MLQQSVVKPQVDFMDTENAYIKVNSKVYSKKEFNKIIDNQIEILEVLSNNQMDSSKIKGNQQYELNLFETYIVSDLLLNHIKKELKKNAFVNEGWIKSISSKLMDYINDQLILKAFMEKILVPKAGGVSDKEIETIYNSNKDKFKGISVTEAAATIKTRLKQQKAMQLLQKLAEKLRNESIIKINEAEFK
jgi:hypothetical protein